ncbi:MAG: hypothetical protein ACW99G_04975 [Candidatus Thorarchaeota archaeon]|jgi:hypothetical protein
MVANVNQKLKYNDLIVYTGGHFIHSKNLIGMTGVVIGYKEDKSQYGYPAVKIRLEEFDYSEKFYNHHTVYEDNLNKIGESRASWEV